MYTCVPIPPWGNFHDDLSNKPSMHRRKLKEWALEDKNWDWWEGVVARYYADVSYVDFCIGRLLDLLKKNSLEKDTVVIFSADHGDSTGSHGLFEKGETMYEETVRIPMIIRYPQGGQDGKTVNGFVRNMDIAATISEIADEKLSGRCDAISMIPLIATKSDFDLCDSIYCEFSGNVWGYVSQRMVRTHDFKYVFNPHDLDELYDLKKDSHELNNLIEKEEYLAIEKEMRARLHGWIKQTHDIFDYPFVLRNLPQEILPILHNEI